MNDYTSVGMPLSQDTLRLRQPDNKLVSIIAYGDMFENYKETIDGYTIVNDDNGFFYIAKHNDKGDLVPSKIRAIDPEYRDRKTERKLKNYPKHLRYKGTKKKEILDNKEKYNKDLEQSKEIRKQRNKNKTNKNK